MVPEVTAKVFTRSNETLDLDSDACDARFQTQKFQLGQFTERGPMNIGIVPYFRSFMRAAILINIRC
jgi:hypothetical protein